MGENNDFDLIQSDTQALKLIVNGLPRWDRSVSLMPVSTSILRPSPSIRKANTGCSIISPCPRRKVAYQPLSSNWYPVQMGRIVYVIMVPFSPFVF
jgi:hypothetical protein